MNLGLHHLWESSKKLENDTFENNKDFKKFINKFIYFIGGFGVAIIVSQVTKIWISKEITGVSLTTWGGFFIASVFWLLYGLVHKAKPIIYTNIAAIFLHFLIILGIFLHRT